MKPTEFDPHADPSFLKGIIERIDAGEVVTFESRHRRKDGTVFPVEVRARLFSDGGRKSALPWFATLANENGPKLCLPARNSCLR